jgi:hypothetical protein
MTQGKNKMQEIIKDLDDRFKNHRVRVRSFISSDSNGPSAYRPIEEFYWAAPGVGDFSCTYLFRRNRLIVFGDLGEAIYVWSEIIPPKFVAETNYDYFIKKYMEIDGPVRLYDWDADRVREKMAQFLEKRVGDGEVSEVFEDWESSIFSEREWELFVYDNQELMEEDATTWGEGINFRSVCHWYGFKLAFKQFRESR